MTPPHTTAAPSGAGEFDEFKTYFVRLIVVAVWFAYAVPIIENLFDGKPMELKTKLKNGWEYIRNRGRKISIKNEDPK